MCYFFYSSCCCSCTSCRCGRCSCRCAIGVMNHDVDQRDEIMHYDCFGTFLHVCQNIVSHPCHGVWFLSTVSSISITRLQLRFAHQTARCQEPLCSSPMLRRPLCRRTHLDVLFSICGHLLGRTRRVIPDAISLRGASCILFFWDRMPSVWHSLIVGFLHHHLSLREVHGNHSQPAWTQLW